MVMPYKRYSTQAVEEILSGTTSVPIPVACENSTMRRIRIWFFLLRSYFESCLQSLIQLFQTDISESRLTPTNFYQILLKQLGVHTVRNRAVAKQQLHEQLAVLQAVHDVSVVCVVDESHLLSFAMLEEIRFLLNTQFDSVSPIALILAGQPELWRRRLALEKCNAIRQRIDIQSVLNHYDRAYTGKYIQRQLAYAGATSELFTEKAVDQIYEYSSGIARMIDKVCTSVLIYGSQNRMRLIDDHAVAKVLEGEFS